MYDPRLGRFLQPDPIGYGAGPNLYAYVGNDPVNLVDPLGLQPCPCGPPLPGDVDVWGKKGAPSSGLWLALANMAPATVNLVSMTASITLPNDPDEIVVTAKRKQKAAPPTFCGSVLYRALDFVDQKAGYGQWIILGGGALGQTEPYRAVRIAFRVGAFKGYAALGAVRDLATIGKFILGDGTTLADLGKALVVKGAGLDTANEVLSDVFVGLAKKTAGVKRPC